MIKLDVLLVDDDSHKINMIREEFEELNEICVATCIDEGIRCLREKIFDVVILDMNLPQKFGDVPDPEGGLRLLRRALGSRTKYNLPKEVIGLTEYDTSMELVQSYFKDNLFSLIKYDRTKLKWVEQIKNKLSYIKSMKENPSKEDYIYDVGFICALQSPELDEVLKIKANWIPHFFKDDNLIYYIGSLEIDDKTITMVAVVSNQMGLSAASVTTMKLINIFKPKLVIMPGIMGGVKEEVNIGDVIVSDPSWDSGDGKYVVENDELKFKQSPLQIRLNKLIEQKTNLIKINKKLLSDLYKECSLTKPEQGFSIHIGPVASGSAVIAASSKVSSLKEQHRKILGLDMEIYGFMYAAENTNGKKPLSVGIKGVSDLANEDKNSLYSQYAARNSVSISIELIKELLIEELF